MDSYLVCYDISDPKRLRKVARACEDYGYRHSTSHRHPPSPIVLGILALLSRPVPTVTHGYPPARVGVRWAETTATP
ncbi:MAG TPA: CRISPR-associated endonuclease Cas2 [Urbifossiella sp.]|nr:CRISPR-associated endonuclease Cas2 [Urbifossiella sp.]